MNLFICSEKKKFVGFLGEYRREYLDICRKVYLNTYTPYCNIDRHNAWGTFMILSSQNVASFQVMNCSKYLLQTSK